MASFKEKPTIRPPKGLGPVGRVKAVDMRCKVCTSVSRESIERMLMHGIGQSEIARFMTDSGDPMSRQNIHNHYHKHMNPQDAAIAKVWSEEARKNLIAETEATIITQEGMLKNLLMLGFQEIVDGKSAWTPKDLLAVMDKYEKIELQKSSVKHEAIMEEGRAFGEAVRMILPEELYAEVIEQYQRNMELKESAYMLTPGSVVEAEVVEEKESV